MFPSVSTTVFLNIILFDTSLWDINLVIINKFNLSLIFFGFLFFFLDIFLFLVDNSPTRFVQCQVCLLVE